MAEARRRVSLAERLIGEGVVVLALAVWWLTAQNVPEFVLPGPVAVGRRLLELFIDPAFLLHTFASTWRVIASVAAALVIGGGLALIAAWVPPLALIIDARIKPVLNSFPSIGWAILVAIWFDVGDFAVIFVQVAILIPFCLINIGEGLRVIDRELIEMGRSFTRSRWRVLARISLPLLLPYIIAALRIAYGIGWKISLVSELLGATTGLGYLMLRAQTTADTATVLAACFAIVVIFVAGEKLVIEPIQRRFTRG